MIELRSSCVGCRKVIPSSSPKKWFTESGEKCHSCYRKTAVKAQNDRCFFCESPKTSNWYHVFNEKRSNWTRKAEQDESERKILNALGDVDFPEGNETWKTGVFSKDYSEKIRLVHCVRCYVVMKPI